MTRGVRRALVAAMVAAALVPASGAESARLRLTPAAGAVFPARSFVLTLPSNRPLQARQVHVRENGNAVADLSVIPARAAGKGLFAVVLVLDTSKSMRGKPIGGALSAAQLFAGRRARYEKLAIVTFDSRARVLLPFSTDSEAIIGVLAPKPPLAWGTHIYDAVGQAISLLREARIAAGSVILLSDGADTGSKSDRETVVAAARRAHVRIFTVGLHSKAFNPTQLRRLAAATGGEFSQAITPGDLGPIYDRLGQQLAREYLIRYSSIADLGSKVRVRANVTGVAESAASGYKTPPLALGPPYRPPGAGFWSSGVSMTFFSLLIAFLLALAIALAAFPRRRGFRRRMAQFVSVQNVEDGDDPAGAVAKHFFAKAEISLEQTRWWQRFKEEVEIAEITMPAVQIVVWTTAGTVLLVWFLFVIAGAGPLPLAGLFLPLVVLGLIRRKVEKTRSEFGDQLPDSLAVLASALRAGHSFVAALTVVAEDAPEPSRSEFQRVVADERLGMPLDDAIAVVVRRMKNEDLAQVGLVAALQRQTGGNTAEVLDRVVETVRERQDLRLMIRSLTAQGRLSRWIVSALPVALILVISLLSPDYLRPLFHNTSGRVLLVFATVMVISGSYVIKRIVEIEI